MKKLLFVSLGCDKNLVDSERMIALLAGHGYELTDDESDAEVIIINTCCFIHDAKEESVENILSMSEQKHSGSCRALVVTGCMAQMYREEILKEIPEVDAVLGTEQFDRILYAVDAAFAGERITETSLDGKSSQECLNRISVTGGFTEYLKIAEGCSKCCTYCIIPSLRGKYRSVPMEQLIAEAEKLVSAGTKELVIVAQETTLYGKDLYGEKKLHELLQKLCRIEGLAWIRVLYCYPEEIYPELVSVIADEPKICRYLDIPIQHCNNEILKKMGRRTSKESLIETIGMLRREIPGIALRTSLISGFPQESEEQHLELLEFVKEMRFERLGVFTYSREDGTLAAEMPGQIPEEEKERRRAEIMEAQQRISLEIGGERLGDLMEAFVEGYLPEEDVYVARTRFDAPNVDGYVFLESPDPLNTGDIVTCEITGADEYDLTGTVAER